MNFEKQPISWGNKGTEPTEDIKQSGFTVGYRPPAAYHNYMFSNAFDCIAEIQNALSPYAGVTASQVSDWNTAYTQRHTHTNKAVLDGITAQKIKSWDGKATNDSARNAIVGEYAELFDLEDYIMYKNGAVMIGERTESGGVVPFSTNLGVSGDLSVSGLVTASDLCDVQVISFSNPQNTLQSISLDYESVKKLLALIK